MRGSVIEINERLISQPELLSDAPQSDGFLCVMLPKLQEKKDLGQACRDFDHSVLVQPSGNEKRRLEGKQVPLPRRRVIRRAQAPSRRSAVAAAPGAPLQIDGRVDGRVD